MDTTTTLTHNAVERERETPMAPLRYTLTGPTLDVQDWGSHGNYALVFPTVEERDAYLAAVAESPEYEEPGMVCARVPVGRYALLTEATAVERDEAGRVTSVTIDPWALDTDENGWYEGTTGGDTLLAEEDRLTPHAATSFVGLAEWLTAHGVPTEAVQ
jgi:hypothetical protein